MKAEVLYHGTDGDSILGILDAGALLPKDGKIYFARHDWQSAFMHGGDRRRGASFVIKVNVTVPENAVSYHTSTHGVGETLVVETTQPLKTEVLELFVRTPGEDGFELRRVIGAQAIRSFLT